MSERSEDLYALPASPGQERMYLIHQMCRGHTPYHVTSALRIRGALNRDALRQALTDVVERHEALRTVLRPNRSGELYQVIRSASPVELPLVELPAAGASSDGDPVARAVDWLTDFARRPFDIHDGPVMRVAVVRLGPADHVLAVVIHHVAVDGWSLGVLLDDLGAAYRARSVGATAGLPELPLQYADFAIWQREQLAGGALDDQIGFWRRTLAGADGLAVPSDPGVGGPAAADVAVGVHLPADRSAEVAAFARSAGATTFIVLLAAFAAVLARWSGRSDLLVVTPVAGRPRPELARVVGFFVNTLPVRIDAGGDPSFEALVGRVRYACLEAFARQDVPFERIAQALPGRGRRPHLARVMMSYDNTPQSALQQMPGATIERLELPARTGGCDLAIDFVTTPDGALRGHLAGGGDRFQPRTVAAWAEALTELLADVAALRYVRVSRLPGPGAQRGAVVTERSEVRS